MSDKIIYKRLDQLTLHQCRDEITRLESELTDLKAKYQRAVEALKFYGGEKNWSCDEGWDGYLVSGVISINDQESIGTSASFEYGGKLARQTLAELGEKE